MSKRFFGFHQSNWATLRAFSISIFVLSLTSTNGNLTSGFDNLSKDVNLKSYLNDLENTKVILCPRGTGPSTIRMWEALASGCIPLVISNDYKFPLNKKIKWADICIVLKEEHTPVIEHYLKTFTENDLTTMQTKGKEIFDKWFSPERMHHIIYEYLKE